MIGIASAETQLLCLSSGQTVKFSKCNPTIQDLTCTGSCQTCVNYNNLTNTYCQTNPNVCNSIPNITCSALISDNQTVDQGNSTTNSTGTQNNSTIDNSSLPGNVTTPGPILVAKSRAQIDIGYILKDTANPDSALISIISQNNYTYELIDDDSLASANFSRYEMLLVWDEYLTNQNIIPITQKKSLTANTYYASDWFISKSVGSQAGSQPSKGNIFAHNITLGLTSPVKLYTTAGIELNYLPNLPDRASGITSVVSTNDSDQYPIIGILNPGSRLYKNSTTNATAKTVFFGITQTAYWTNESKTLFKNSLDWLIKESVTDHAPVITPLYPEILDEKGLLTINVSASDAENDTLSYSINDSRFTQNNNLFFWQTHSGDAGKYTFQITVSDGILNSTALINVNVLSNQTQNNQTNQSSPILLTINSPLSQNYTTNNILVDISSVNATNVWYNINNGINITYSSPTIVNFPNGTNTLFAFASNNLGNFATTSLTFSVIPPSNTPTPINVSNIPDLVWNENGNYTLNLSNYFSSSKALIFGVENTSNGTNIALTNLSSELFLFTSTPGWSGSDWIQFFAWNGETKAVSNIINLMVNHLNTAPFLLNPLPQNIIWPMNENNTHVLNLNNYFKDLDSNLTFTVSGNSNISVTIDSNGYVDLIPPADWFGNESVTFNASDSEFQISSNLVLLEVKFTGKKPVFDNLTCDTIIDEDTQHSCIITATDAENDTINFSTGASNNLNCSMNSNILTYQPANNFNGNASCTLIASDVDGLTAIPFSVTVNPVNDAPTIISSSPALSVITLIEGNNQTLSLSAFDVDSQAINVSWFVNNQLNRIDQSNSGSLSSSFIFSNAPGNYKIDAIVTDGNLSTNRTWNIVIGKLSQYTCSQVGGNVCSGNLACPTHTLGVKDTSLCCPASCAPSFNSAGACSADNQNSIGISITDPIADDIFHMGSDITVNAFITNNLNKTQNYLIRSFLYNLDTNTVEETDSADLSLHSGSSDFAKMDIVVPDDASEGNYAMLIRASGNGICNQTYNKLSIERPASKIIVSGLNTPDTATCGDTIRVRTTTENIGTESQDVNLYLTGASFISASSISFGIDAFDSENDVITKDFSLNIPDNITGTYSIRATANYNGLSAESATNKIDITCPKKSTEVPVQTSVQLLNNTAPTKLNPLSGKKTSENPSANNSLILTFLLLMTLWLVAGVIVILIIAGRKK